MKLLLLLALVVSLRRMLVSCFGFVSCLSRLLLCTHVLAAAVLLRGRPMSLRSLLMMFGSLLVHILRHNISLLFEGSRAQRPRFGVALMLPMEVERRLRFVAVFLGSSLQGKPKARVYRLTWRVGPEPQWEGKNKSPGAPAATDKDHSIGFR
jgi:hypothetical protein